jgi:hypothetical protein
MAKRRKMNPLRAIETIEKDNPFIDGLDINADNLVYVDEDEKQVASFNIETSDSVTLYFNKEKKDVIRKLSPSSKQLFVWLLLELPRNKDYIWFNRPRYRSSSKSSTSDPTIKKSIEELVENNIIAITAIFDVFYINPYYFYNGNRTKQFKDKVSINRKVTKPLNNKI